MTKDEALDLALETLESIQAAYPCETVGKRITAIKQARAQPEERYTYGTPLLDLFTKEKP